MSPSSDEPAPPPFPQSASAEPPVYQVPPAAAAPPVHAGAPREPLNPWTAIFTRPRAVMRQILDGDPSRRVHLLAVAGGIVESLGSDVRMLSHLGMTLGSIIVLKVIVGALGGLLLLYVGSGLLLLTGRWLGGRGTFVEVRAATAWTNVPVLWGALLWLPLLGYLGFAAFNLDMDALRTDSIGLLLLVPIGIAGFVLLIWRVVIYCKCLGEAHRFSAWHSLGAALIASLLVAIPLGIMAVLAVTIGGLALLSGS